MTQKALIDFPAKALRRVRQLVNLNNHGEAYQLIATTLGCTELADKFAAMNAQCDRDGGLSLSASSRRHELYMELMAFANATLSGASYRLLYMAT